jgi:hypothetical protein
MFSLNFAGPSYSSIKQDSKKGFQFIPGEYKEVFQSVARIYKQAMEHHGLQAPIPVILAEDKTKVKSKVCWEHKLDALTKFYVPKDDHVCVPTYKVIVGL